MLGDGLRSIAHAQVERLRIARASDPPELADLVRRAVSADDVRQALLKERPVLEARRTLRILGPDPQEMREEAVAAGVLDASPNDLAYRRLYPGLDLGVYAANHSMGKPSMAFEAAIAEHWSQLWVHGTGAMQAGWLDAIDRFRRDVARLVGGDLLRGDVASWPNFSEGLSAVLSGLSGRMVSDAGHFTTARYAHRAWADRTGSELVEIPEDALGCVPTERICDALTPDTTVVSLAHALWRTGYVHDLDLLARAMRDVCPDAALVLDVYQSLGTVPVDIGRLPMATAVLGGGIKQLHAGTGAGFGWISHPLLARIVPDRTGWWAHEAPMAFDPEFRLGHGAAILRTGTPDIAPMVALSTEIAVLATSTGGDLRMAIERARDVTRNHVRQAIEACEELGLVLSGPTASSGNASHSADRRAAFLAVHVDHGERLVAELADQGVFVDFRADTPGARAGLLRVSTSAASFSYEILYALEKAAELSRKHG